MGRVAIGMAGELSLAVAEVVNRERDARGVSVRALADAMPGGRRTRVTEILAGKRAPNMDEFEEICAALDLDSVAVLSEAVTRVQGVPRQVRKGRT